LRYTWVINRSAWPKLHFGEGGAGVDEEGGVGVAQGVGQRARWGDDAGPAVPAGDEAVHGLQVERYVGAFEAADEEGVGGGVAPRSLHPGVEIPVHLGDDFRSDRDDSGFIALAEHPQTGGPLGGLNRADPHGNGLTAADPGAGEHGEQRCISFRPRIPSPGIGVGGGLGDPFQLGVFQRLGDPLGPLRAHQSIHRIRQQTVGRDQVTPEPPPRREHAPH
jgi:hypothetical protein